MLVFGHGALRDTRDIILDNKRLDVVTGHRAELEIVHTCRTLSWAVEYKDPPGTPKHHLKYPG